MAATAQTRGRPKGKEEVREEVKVTREAREVREDTRVTKGIGTRAARAVGAQEAKVTRVAQEATKEVQEEVRKETREVTEEASSLTAKGPVTGAARKVTLGQTAQSRPTKLAAAQGGTSPVPWASSSRAATPLRQVQEETRSRGRRMKFRR